MKAPAGISIRKITRESGEWKTRYAAFYADFDLKDVDGLDHAFFAAYSGEEIAGHSVVYLEEDRWVLDGLRVKPEFRERGIAKALTAARIRYAAGRGAKEVWYSCEDGNLVTTCCHLRFGFEKMRKEGPACRAGTANWYRLKITPSLFKKFPDLKPPAGHSVP
ncbi:MAG: GNAT family N-acetyltransferase [Elusimicrobia bacterium]|nr:GNAT family N-acetyltransferase [Elusimicrobiota bacterium]